MIDYLMSKLLQDFKISKGAFPFLDHPTVYYHQTNMLIL